MRRLEADGLKMPGIVHGFFGRDGGVSTGIYSTLNCGPGSRDAPAAVAQNRHLATASLAPGLALIGLAQVHSATVHTIFGQNQAPLAGDGLVTATPGLALGILTADCAPVLLLDAQAGVIAAAHAGWKGALGQDGFGVLEATLQAMERLGAARPRIRAAIGPCIGQGNYEVEAAFRDRFLLLNPEHQRYFRTAPRAHHYGFDLAGYVGERLTRAGAGSVESLGICTYPPENGFFSYRRATHAGEPDYGRQISAIARIA